LTWLTLGLKSKDPNIIKQCRYASTAHINSAIEVAHCWIKSKSISSHEPGEAPGILFFHPDGENRPSRAPGSSISSGFGHSSIRQDQAIPGLPGRARGLRTKEASSSARYKSCRRWTSSHAARQVNVRPPIYGGLPRVWPATFSHFSSNPLSTYPKSFRRAMANNGSDDDGATNNGFGRCSLHQWEGWRATRRRPTSACPEVAV
jgi:hypothetical protein